MIMEGIEQHTLLWAGKREFLFFTYVSESRAVHDRWEMVSLTLVESVSFLEAQAA